MRLEIVGSIPDLDMSLQAESSVDMTFDLFKVFNNFD
jgi:hypothetical protein